MPWLDVLAVQNWELNGTDPLVLDTTGPESVDISVVLDRPEDTIGPVTITTDKNLAIRGVNYGNLILINDNPYAVLSLSGDLVIIGGTVDDSQFAGTLQTNGYRLITQKSLDVLAEQNYELYGAGPFVLDFTGSAQYRDEFWVTLGNVSGDTVIDTGRKDVLLGVEFNNTVTVHVTGKTSGLIDLLGAGSVEANNLEHVGFNTDNFTGTLEYGSGTIISRPTGGSIAYTASQFVHFYGTDQTINNEVGFIHNAGNIG